MCFHMDFSPESEVTPVRFARLRVVAWVLDFGDKHNRRNANPFCMSAITYLVLPSSRTEKRECQALTGVYPVSQAVSS